MATGIYLHKSLSEEHKRKIGLANKGKWLSDETKRKIGLANSIALKGKHLSEEHKRKIGLSSKGNKRRLGTHHNLETKQKMRESHLGRKYKSMSDIGRRNIGLSHKGKSSNRKGKHHSEESIKKMSRENHHNWQGGISFEPYPIDWTRTLKRAIRERDKYTCEICSQEGFQVHHIDYDKKNCDPNNLTTLCKRCHTKTNYNRDQWIEYFKEKLRW